jgi:hypothetical protein
VIASAAMSRTIGWSDRASALARTARADASTLSGRSMRLRSPGIALLLVALIALSTPGSAHAGVPPRASDVAGLHLRVTLTTNAPQTSDLCLGSVYGTDGSGAITVQTIAASTAGWTARAHSSMGGGYVALSTDGLVQNFFTLGDLVAPDGSVVTYNVGRTMNCTPDASAVLAVGGVQSLIGSWFNDGPAEDCISGTLARTGAQTFVFDMTVHECAAAVDLTGLSFSLNPIYQYPYAYTPCATGASARDYLEQLVPLTPTVGGWTLTGATLSAQVTEGSDGRRSFAALAPLILISPARDDAIMLSLSGPNCASWISPGTPSQLTLSEVSVTTSQTIGCVDLTVQVSGDGGIIATSTGQHAPGSGTCPLSSGGPGGGGNGGGAGAGGGGAGGSGGGSGGGGSPSVGLDGASAAAMRSHLGFRFANTSLDETPAHHVDPATNVSWPAYVLTWGRSQTYTVVNRATGETLPNPDAQAIYNADLRAAHNGYAQCFGFASIALLRAANSNAPDFPVGSYDLAARYPDYNTALGTSKSSISIFQDIHARFMTQLYGQDFLAHVASYDRSKVDGSTIRSAVDSALRAGKYPMLTYVFNSRSGGVEAHAVVALGIRDSGSGNYGEYQIITLDSNFPLGGTELHDPSHGIIYVKNNHFSTLPDYFAPVSQPVNADTMDVVPMQVVDQVYPRASWIANSGVAVAGSMSLAAARSDDGDIVIRTLSARITQLTGTGTRLFADDGTVDRSSQGIPGVAFTSDEAGADSVVDAPDGAYVLTVLSPGLGDVEVVRGAVATHIALPASPSPADVIVPTDPAAPVLVRAAGEVGISLVQHGKGGSFRVASLHGPAGVGLSITPSHEVRLAGSATSITLSALGGGYAAQTATIALGARGATAVRPAWAAVASAPIAVSRSGRRQYVNPMTPKVIRADMLRLSQNGRRLEITLRVRVPTDATVTTRLTLRRHGRLVRRWTATGDASRIVITLPRGDYTVNAAIAAVAAGPGYRVETRAETART